jgi:hypothetical protein
MVTHYGMSKLGLLSFPETGDEYAMTKPYSPQMELQIEQEVNSIINECAQRTRELVRKHKDDIERMAQALLKKETVDLIDIVDILGPRPFGMSDAMKEYFTEIENRKKLEQEKKAAQSLDSDKKDDDSDSTGGKQIDGSLDDKGTKEGTPADSKHGQVGMPPKDPIDKKIKEAETIVKIVESKKNKLI